MFVAKLYDDARAAGRVEAGVGSTLRDEARRPHDVVVDNLSSTGCGIETRIALRIGAAIRIGLPGTGVHAAHVVRRDGDFYGCAFDVPISGQAVQTALTFDSLVDGSFGRTAETDTSPQHPAAPAVTMLPPKTRLAIIIGSSALLWAVILGARALLIG